MGWWYSNETGGSLELVDNDHYWGDGPADVMDSALDNIRQQFRDTFGREPKLSEIISGVMFCLGETQYSAGSEN